MARCVTPRSKVAIESERDCATLRIVSRVDWSIKFDSRDSVDSFTTHLTIAVGLKSGNLYFQDLELGSGDVWD